MDRKSSPRACVCVLIFRRKRAKGHTELQRVRRKCRIVAKLRYWQKSKGADMLHTEVERRVYLATRGCRKRISPWMCAYHWLFVDRTQGKVAKDRVRFIHGHSAWATGQLQNELKLNQVIVQQNGNGLQVIGSATFCD